MCTVYRIVQNQYFNNYLLSTFYVPGTVLGADDIVLGMIEPCSQGADNQVLSIYSENKYINKDMNKIFWDHVKF